MAKDVKFNIKTKVDSNNAVKMTMSVVRGVDYRAEPAVNLHVVTDWSGSCSAGSPFREESLRVFDILESIHSVLFGLEGDTFSRFHLAGCQTNHNHEEIIENIETYQCVALKHLG